jgi:hypothetical protein
VGLTFLSGVAFTHESADPSRRNKPSYQDRQQSYRGCSSLSHRFFHSTSDRTRCANSCRNFDRNTITQLQTFFAKTSSNNCPLAQNSTFASPFIWLRGTVPGLGTGSRHVGIDSQKLLDNEQAGSIILVKVFPRQSRLVANSIKKAECKFAPRHESRMDRLKLPPYGPSA